jgi:hypothetical protein
MTTVTTPDISTVGHGVNVPRSRFLPVKSCSDLLLIKSDIYSLEHGHLILNPSRVFDTIPVIKLSDHFKKARFAVRPKLLPNFPADRPVPKEVQEDPACHRVGPSDGLWGRLLRSKHYTSWDCHRYIFCSFTAFPDTDLSLQSLQMRDRGSTSLMAVSLRTVSGPSELCGLAPLMWLFQDCCPVTST